MKEYYKHLCKCGCDGKIEIKYFHKFNCIKIPEYINGHNLKNKPKSKEHKKKIGDSNRGNILPPKTEEQKQKVRDLWKDPIYREKMLKALNKPEVIIKKIGSNNPAWRGGVSYGPYCEIWNDQEYKNTIKERDKHVCQNPFCWGKNKELLLHHINYNKEDCKPKNLITVCRSCNGRANTKRDLWQFLYSCLTTSRDFNIKLILPETFEELERRI